MISRLRLIALLIPITLCFYGCQDRSDVSNSKSKEEQVPNQKLQRPNIVFILSDDQPFSAMSHNDPWFSTPNLDKLASESVVFDNAFVTTSICAVSRASIFTGQHSIRHGIYGFDKPLSSVQLQNSYSGLLRSAGYRTAFLGKYAIGNPRSRNPKLYLPKDHFDYWYGFKQGVSYSQKIDGKERYVTTVMEEKAIEFIRETPKDQPFLLILALPEPHGQKGPWNYRDPDFKVKSPKGPTKKPESMNIAAYDNLPLAVKGNRKSIISGNFGRLKLSYEKHMEIVREFTARADLSVGRIRQELKDLGIENNTIVIYTSDNGSMRGAHGIAGKWNMYEESIRVPMMVLDPRLSNSTHGHRSQMALNIDIAPTIVELAGLQVPEAMQGASLIPLLNDTMKSWRKYWYYEHDNPRDYYKNKLPRCEGVRTERWKYIRYKDTDPLQEELFDLQEDPLELNNLIDNPEQTVIVKELRARLYELRQTLR